MGRRVVDLNGHNWELGQAPPGALPHRPTCNELDSVTEWLPATVPGNIRTDLVRCGHLPDLFYGTQARTSQWVDDHCWWLNCDPSLAAGSADRIHLVLRGVDYISDVFFNGHHLGRHEGMFSPQIHDITTLLRDSNHLAIRILGSKWLPADRSSPAERLWNFIESRAASIGRRHPQRRDTLKCQMGFGWDFAPPLRTMGIWDDVYAIISGDVFIRHVAVNQRLDQCQAHLTTEIELDAAIARKVEIHCTLTGDTFDVPPSTLKKPIELPAGTSRHSFEVSLTRPRLWWSWDHGRPDLYRLHVEVWAGSQLLDAQSQTVGLRQLDLDGWALHLNGRRVYARGANWVPANILPGQVTQADYHTILSLARQANMNMLRVWGGGLREKRAFYDLCDRMGILVWQEFPFACAFLTRFPRSRGYLELVERETRAIVRDLRHHPSLALWCGGNEFSPRRNAPLVTVLQRITRREDSSRPFLPASPEGGDSHNWSVWHHFRPPSAYRDDHALFASEFGLQAPPDVAALRRFIPPDEVWPPGPAWTFHGAELEKLRRYARPFLPDGKTDLETFVQASQYAQSSSLQIAIEHHRRRKAQGGGGALVWQLNEPWPAISWALLSHDHQPKPAYEMIKRLFTPQLVSLDYELRRYRAGDQLACDVWAINDGHERFNGCTVDIMLWDATGTLTEQFSIGTDLAADSASVLGSLRFTLPPGDHWRLTSRLHREGQILSTNQYDVAIHDQIQPTLRQRTRAWLSSLVVPS